jgi:hypothetical protein
MWLQRNLPDVPIVAGYEIAYGKADLVIEGSHVIELTFGFTRRNLWDCDRCIGQLERYRQKLVNSNRGVVYLVVVGKSAPEFRDMIHNAIEQLNHICVVKCFFLVEKYVE